ncbi:MAG: cobamide remodeling phosphodiesterase CbiR [Thermodesulfobacteriota bacterium]|nr:cobamide remodeling phosphodiesterase CbiR [Thermodesulfobacteriota bacterium]
MTPAPVAYKGMYPFFLACPSFVYPAGYAENVRRLAPLVDEIELLLFESGPERLPSTREIGTLKTLSASCAVAYNVHLPIDVSIAAADRAEARAAEKAIGEAVDRARSLVPTSWTLHVPCDQPNGTRPSRIWEERVCRRLDRILTAHSLPPRALALETLDYPPFFLYDIVETLDCSVCLDLGHLAVKGYDSRAAFDLFRHRIAIIHAHGASGTEDHLALNALAAGRQQEMLYMLSNFAGTLSLEVFSAEALFASLDCLDRLWHTVQKTGNC